ILRAIEKTREFTDDDEEYIRDVLQLLDDGAIPKGTIKNLLKKVEKQPEPLKILGIIKSEITDVYFQPVIGTVDTSGPKEVILSEYFEGEFHS
ncbi:MAG: hypothetical protein GYA51_09205, partial [Candidatus Methanofastidiosa archaeon]|nr:hypothetical protein [Candidatus Methanofastidiosa archaeon]